MKLTTLCLATAVLLTWALPGACLAADLYWAGDVDANWNIGAGGNTNWSSTAGSNTNSTALPGSGDNAHFGIPGAANLASTLDAAFTIDRLVINGNVSNVAINTTNTNPLTFSSHSGPRTLVFVADNTGDHVFTGTAGGSGAADDVILGANSTGTDIFDIGANSSFEFAARLGHTSSSGTLEKIGDGTLILSANNGGTGGWNFSSGSGFTVSNGILQIANSGATGNSSNDYTVNSGGTIELNNASYNSNNGDLTLNGNGESNLGAIHNLAGNNVISAGNGQVLLATGSQIRVAGGSLTIDQDVNGNGSLIKRGGGVLTLTAVNGYTGGTTIGTSGGTLLVNGTHNTGGNYTTLSGNAALGGDGTIGGSGSVTINSSTDMLLPGASLGTIGSLTITKDFTLNGILELDVLGTAIDQVLGIDELSFGGSSTLDIVGTLTEPTYTVMTFASRPGATMFGDISAVTSQNYLVVYDDALGEVRLEAGPIPEPTAMGLMLFGTIGVVCLLYRRRRRNT